MDKETFKKEAQQKIDFLSEKIDELQKRLEPVATDVRQEAKIAGEKALAELRELRDSLQVHVDEFQKAAEVKWNTAMKHMDAATDEILRKANAKINQVWEKLKGVFD